MHLTWSVSVTVAFVVQISWCMYCIVHMEDIRVLYGYMSLYQWMFECMNMYVCIYTDCQWQWPAAFLSHCMQQATFAAVTTEGESYVLLATYLATEDYWLSPPHELPQITRKIPRIPYRILDAPDLQDDFYLNLLDWSAQNLLAVGLGSTVYLWNASSGQVTKLCDFSHHGDVVTSVAWSSRVSWS